MTSRLKMLMAMLKEMRAIQNKYMEEESGDSISVTFGDMAICGWSVTDDGNVILNNYGIEIILDLPEIDGSVDVRYRTADNGLEIIIDDMPTITFEIEMHN